MLNDIKIESKEISLKEFCTQLSISQATGKNWLKLGKIKSRTKNNVIYFDQEYINRLKEEIQNDENKVLKSRRNKKFVSGNIYYKSYIGNDSENLKIVEQIVNYIKNARVAVTKHLVRCIINEYALQIIFQKINNKSKISNALYKLLVGRLNIKKYSKLFDISDSEAREYLKIIKEHSKIFEMQYEYEPSKDIMGLIYISLNNLGKRKVTGTYYTPEKIVKKLNNQLFKGGNIANKKVLDPCCGTGNFLLNLPYAITFEQIYAMDIDEESIYITRLNMAIKYSIDDLEVLNKHIFVRDYLKSTLNDKYDYILGNPPWGYDFSNAEKEYLINEYYSAYGKNIESFDLFIEKSKLVLNKNGYISFVLPEALLNVKSHYRIREIIFNKFDIKYLEYLGNAFDGVQCPSIIIKIKYTNNEISTKGLEVKNSKTSFTIKTNRELTPDYFSFTMDDYEYGIIKQINSLSKKVFLKNNSIFALGIVTGDNDKYISTKKADDNEMIIRGKAVFKYKYMDTDEYILFKPKQFQQVAPSEYYRISPKLFYRFISNKLVFAYDDRSTLSLNSCNILIPMIKNINIKYILAVLNSSVAQFYFDKNFNSIKILRSHIESIPIPIVTKEKENEIVNKVDVLLKSHNNEQIIKVYDEIDREIAKIYNIDSDKYGYILKLYEKDEKFMFAV